MAKTPEQYAEWLVTHQDKQGTPEWETVAEAYRQSRGHTQPRQETPAPSSPSEANWVDRRLGDWSGRVILGSPLATIPMAVTQLVGGERGRELVAAIEASKQRGMKHYGKEGFDWYGLLGGVMGGAPVAKAIASKLPQATNFATRALQNVLIGGASAATQPVHHGATGEPVAESDFWGRKADQTFTGGVLGGLVSLGADATKFGWDVGKSILSPLWQKGRERLLHKYQDKLAGSPENKAKIIAALERFYKGRTVDPKTAPTVSQILSDIPGATGFHADQVRVAQAPGVSPAFAARSAAQEQARQAALEPMARNPGAVEGLKAIRDTVTAPMREDALTKANAGTARYYASQVHPPPMAKTGELRTARELFGVPPKPLQSAVQKFASDFPAVTPLSPKTLTKGIRHTLNEPGIRASDVVQKTLSALEEKIDGLARAHGGLDARDIYMVKKEAGNLVEKFAKETQTFDKQLTAGLVTTVKQSIDRAVEQAGGRGWTQYLKTYAEISDEIARLEAGQQLQQALTSPLGRERPLRFANAALKPEIRDALTPQDRKVVDAVAQELARNDKVKYLAGQTTGAHGVDLEKERNLLDRRMMFASWLMEHFGRVPARDQLNQMAAGQYLDGQKMLEALKHGPTPPWVEEVADAIAKQLPMASGVAVGRQY